MMPLFWSTIQITANFSSLIAAGVRSEERAGSCDDVGLLDSVGTKEERAARAVLLFPELSRPVASSRAATEGGRAQAKVEPGVGGRAPGAVPGGGWATAAPGKTERPVSGRRTGRGRAGVGIGANRPPGASLRAARGASVC